MAMIKKNYKLFFLVLLGSLFFIFIQIYHYPLALLIYSFFPHKEERFVVEKDPLTQHIEAFNASFEMQMKDELDLIVQPGISRYHENPFEVISLNIPTGQQATLAEGRALLIYITERYVEAINHSELLEPYLKERPFIPKNLGVRIYFNGKDRRIADGNLTQLSKGGTSV